MSENSGREVRLDALVNKLHSEGVKRGQAEAEKIREEARKEAETIRQNARNDAETALAQAKAKAEEFQENALASIRLAARDTTRALAHSVQELFDKAFKTTVAAELDQPEFVKDLILKLADSWAQGQAVSVEMHPNLGEKLLALAKTGVDRELDDGIEIRLNRSIANGFRIRRTGDQVAYDFTDEAVVEGLKLHLNAKITELLEP
jgi:V/A-type H+-transporting ATPase subunit E